MSRALWLAKLGYGYVSPNPMVGAVIVNEDTIIGEGWHRAFGCSHAEALAIQEVLNNYKDAPHLLATSTMYITLDPCCHHGKTPPCTDSILNYKLPKLVVGSFDPNPTQQGKGLRILLDSGIDVLTDVLGRECRDLNRNYFCYYQNKRPFITLKWAQSSDGFINEYTAERTFLTDSISSIYQHKYRAGQDAILVGFNTAKLDNPNLNLRDWHGKLPIRMVIDKYLMLSSSLNLFDGTSPTVIFNHSREDLQNSNRFVKLDFSKPNICAQIIEFCFKHKIQSLLVEGGRHTIQLFHKAGLWDELHIYISPRILRQGLPVPDISYANATLTCKQKLFNDHLLIYKNTSSTNLSKYLNF